MLPQRPRTLQLLFAAAVFAIVYLPYLGPETEPADAPSAPAGGASAAPAGDAEVLKLVRAMNASLGAVDARLGAVEARLGVFADSVDARFAAVDARLGAFADSVDARFAAVDARFAHIGTSLRELVESTVTVSAAMRVDACARSNVWHFVYFANETSLNGSVDLRERSCSAFAFAPAVGAATAVVTANHCTESLRLPGSSVSLEGVGGLPNVTCTLDRNFEPKNNDAAVLLCPGASAVAGLAPSATADAHLRRYLPVGVTGFAVDAYADSQRHLTGPRKFALNVDFAHIAGVVGPGIDASGALCKSSSASRVDCGEGAPPLGYVDRRVTPGMSGGPVLDMACGIVGIACGRSCAAGAFASLKGVVDYFLKKPR
jgi:hypothetical protein